MKILKFLPSFILGLFLFGITSCTKENVLADNQKSIKKSWTLQQYLLNDADKTATLEITGYEESYTDNSRYDRSYTDRNGDRVTENGTYQFENATKLNITGIGSMEMSSQIGTVSTSYYNIIKVNDTQFWYYYTNGGDRHEFHLTKK
jgi:hypothetical protein